MKTKTCIVLTSLMMVFSCTVNEDADAPELEATSLKFKSPVMEILSKEGGKKALSSFFTPGNAAKGNGNGVVFIKNAADYVACSFGEDRFVCFYEIDENGPHEPHRPLARFPCRSLIRWSSGENGLLSRWNPRKCS